MQYTKEIYMPLEIGQLQQLLEQYTSNGIFKRLFKEPPVIHYLRQWLMEHKIRESFALSVTEEFELISQLISLISPRKRRGNETWLAILQYLFNNTIAPTIANEILEAMYSAGFFNLTNYTSLRKHPEPNGVMFKLWQLKEAGLLTEISFLILMSSRPIRS